MFLVMAIPNNKRTIFDKVMLKLMCPNQNVLSIEFAIGFLDKSLLVKANQEGRKFLQL